MIVRPKLFLDTNVLINAADGRIPCDEWTRVRQHINAHFQYCISSVTWKELIVGVARCDDAHFNKNKERLRVLCSLDSGTFLPYPPVFALRMVLGLHSAARTSETGNVSEEVWEEAVLKAVLAAPIKAQIKIDLNDIDKDENVPQNEHADLLQGIREGQIDKPSPRKWPHGFSSSSALLRSLTSAISWWLLWTRHIVSVAL